MRKGLLSVILIFLSSILCAASVRGVNIEDTFESTDNLSLFTFTGDVDDASYYDDVHFHLVTQAPGDEVYTWFGHTGLMMESPQGSIMFDWGTFSFSPSFYLDFCFGRLYYTVSTNRADAVINRAISENRRVEITELPMDAAAKKGLMEFLAYNTQKENRNYLYHYYLDNCATRVRDIIDFTGGGAFRAWAESIMTGMTFRDLSTLYMNRNWLVSFTLNFLQGPSIDRQLNLYEACFLPDVLNSAVKTFYSLDGNVVFQGEDENNENLPLVCTTLMISLALTLILFLLRHFRHERLYGLVSAVIWLYTGIASSVLFFMMFFTNHDVTYFNENLIFMNPLVFIIAFQNIAAVFRPGKTRKASMYAARILLILSMTDIVLKGLFPLSFIQDNAPVFAFILPLYLLTAFPEKERKPQISEKETDCRHMNAR